MWLLLIGAIQKWIRVSKCTQKLFFLIGWSFLANEREQQQQQQQRDSRVEEWKHSPCSVCVFVVLVFLFLLLLLQKLNRTNIVISLKYLLVRFGFNFIWKIPGDDFLNWEANYRVEKKPVQRASISLILFLLLFSNRPLSFSLCVLRARTQAHASNSAVSQEWIVDTTLSRSLGANIY